MLVVESGDQLSSTVLELSLIYVQRCQQVTPLPVIQASKLVAFETLFAFVRNVGVGIASAGAMQNRCDALADLWNGDCRCPFFSPAVLPSLRTSWQ